mmetsp:Transcript_46719/g.109121  ORF Transcript_46719/g.109121 Transcript_46719/m.109121 type:complete len:86 (-) Transcript_46719:460-717(-)
MGNIILGAGEEGLRLLPAVVSVSFLVYFIVKAVFGGCRPFLHQLRFAKCSLRKTRALFMPPFVLHGKTNSLRHGGSLRQESHHYL